MRMNVEKFLQFYIPNLTLIIEILFAVVILSILAIAVLTFLRKDEKEGGDYSQIEKSLKKILEQTKFGGGGASTSATADGSAGAASDGGVPNADGGAPADPNAPAGAAAVPEGTPEEQVLALLGKVQNLEKQLKEKEAAMGAGATAGAEGVAGAEGEAAAAGGKAAVSGEDKAKLEARIKELEGRLAEYEIIEEDIADLSHYKEENKMLSDQLAQMRVQLAEAAAAEPAPSEATPPLEVVAEPAPAPEAAAPTPALAAKVEESDVVRSLPEEPAATAPVVAEVVPTEAEAAADPMGGDMNFDRMLEEAQGLESAPAEEGANALDQQMDESKLIAEAAELEAATPQDEKKDAELMNQFENFVEKKG